MRSYILRTLCNQINTESFRSNYVIYEITRDSSLPLANDFISPSYVKISFFLYAKYYIWTLQSHLFNFYTKLTLLQCQDYIFFQEMFLLVKIWLCPFKTVLLVRSPFTQKAKNAHNRFTRIANFRFGNGFQDAVPLVDSWTASGQTIECCFWTTAQSIRIAQTALRVLQWRLGISMGLGIFILLKV